MYYDFTNPIKSANIQTKLNQVFWVTCPAFSDFENWEAKSRVVNQQEIFGNYYIIFYPY